MERADRTGGDGTAVVTPWLSPYETRTTHFPFQKWGQQSSGAWERGGALSLIQRMLAWRESSASKREKSNRMSLCQSPHCSDEHARLQEQGDEDFLSHN